MACSDIDPTAPPIPPEASGAADGSAPRGPTGRRRPRVGRHPRWAVGLGAVALAVGLTACGGAAASKTDAGGTTDTTGGAASGAAYRDCMSQHGVTLPARQGGFGQGGSGQGGSGQGPSDTDPGAGQRGQGTLPPGVDQATMQKAQDACQSLRPQRGNGGGAGGGTAFAAYASCMKDKGIVIPARGQGGSSDTTGSTIDRTSAAYKAANDVCKALLPAPGQGTGSTDTTAAP